MAAPDWLPPVKPVGRAEGNEAYRLRRRWVRMVPGRRLAEDDRPRNPGSLGKRSFVVQPNMEIGIAHGRAYGRSIRLAMPHGNAVLVEWDMAVGPIAARVLEEHIDVEPERIWVVPYWMHNTRHDGRPQLSVHNSGMGVIEVAAWARAREPAFGGGLAELAQAEAERMEQKAVRYEECRMGQAECDTFGFGLVWLPRAVLELAWADGLDVQMVYPDADSTFGRWCADRGIKARICWPAAADVVHLHW